MSIRRKIGTTARLLRDIPPLFLSMGTQPTVLRRFFQLRNRFAEQYQSVARFEEQTFTIPAWQKNNEILLEQLLPRPPLGFLRLPRIDATMVLRGKPKITAEQLLFLKSQSPQIAIQYEPVIGLPYFHSTQERFSANSVHHTYHLARFLKETSTSPDSIKTIVEWGGGYGNLARIAYDIFSPKSYTLIDSPLMCALQWLYLASIFGPERVRLVNEHIEPDEHSINIIPIGLWKHTPTPCDLFISTWALSESTTEAQNAVAVSSWFGARHLLIAYQAANASFPEAGGIAQLATQHGAQIFDVISSMQNSWYAMK